MSSAPEVEMVDTEDEYVHVRFRDPDEFDTIRTPDWAEDPAESVAEGAEVRTGKREDADDWELESVLIPADTDEDTARDQAREIAEKIES